MKPPQQHLQHPQHIVIGCASHPCPLPAARVRACRHTRCCIRTKRTHSYLPHAFLVNGVQVEGPILALPDTWLLWDVRGWRDVTPSSLALLDLLDPPPELLVLGCGDGMRPLPAELRAFLDARGIAAEVLDTVGVLFASTLARVPKHMLLCRQSKGKHACLPGGRRFAPWHAGCACQHAL